MAAIRERLSLDDGFSSTLTKYAEKLKAGMDRTEDMQSSMDKIAASSAFETLDNNTAAWVLGMQNAKKPAEDLSDKIREMANTFSDLQSEAIAADENMQKFADDGLSDIADESEEAESKLQKLGNAAKNATRWLLGINRTHSVFDGVTKKITAMALSFVTARKLISYLRNAIERAPEDIAKPMEKFKTGISDLFAGSMVSVLAGMTEGFNRLNQALKSDAGKKFARGMETIGRAVGTVLSVALEKAASLIEWLGDNFQTVAAVGAAVLGLLAIRFAVVAGAAFAAHAQTILWIAVIAMLGSAIFGLVEKLTGSAVTVNDVFSFVGELIGWLYSVGYNTIADSYNLIAGFVEFFANVWNDPLGSVARLFSSVFDSILGIVENVAGAIGVLFGKDWATEVSNFRAKMNDFVVGKFGEPAIVLDRMEHIDYETTMNNFGDKAAALGESLSSFSLENAKVQAIKKIESNTGSIAKAITDEDLKSLIEVAERAFVAQVNLTSETPVINITGQNTGNTEADARALGEAIKTILIEQVASGSTTSPYVFSGN